jgi:hypothetical protein
MWYKCCFAHKEGIQKCGDTTLLSINLETRRRYSGQLHGSAAVCMANKILVTPEKAGWALIVDSDTSEKRNTLFLLEI